MEDRFKFRAWDKVRKAMLSNGYPLYIDLSGDFYEHEGEECYSASGDSVDGIYDLNTDDFVLMQSTGLKDKNGKIIFEGDVVSQYGGREYSLNYVINWHQDRCGFYLSLPDGKPHFDLGNHREGLQIIGNIHENPELLERKE